MTEIKESSSGENLEKLKNENSDLRRRIKELQKENASLREKLSHTKKESPIPDEEKKPLKLFKKQKNKELPDSTKGVEEPAVSKEMDLEITSEFESPSVPLSTRHKSIIDGHSRRMCPSCDNTRHQFIYEETDKTHILMDYPRIYGKKYKCGECGQEWRVPVSLE
jgi:hypothetical protein